MSHVFSIRIKSGTLASAIQHPIHWAIKTTTDAQSDHNDAMKIFYETCGLMHRYYLPQQCKPINRGFELKFPYLC